jgi:large subunit ribosomal protein L13
VTGNKYSDREFHWYTGYPGGIKSRTYGQILESKHPERLIQKAVERMMPKESPLARKQMKKLHVYAGAEHKHEAQKPEVLDLAAMNPKNKRSA